MECNISSHENVLNQYIDINQILNMIWLLDVFLCLQHMHLN